MRQWLAVAGGLTAVMVVVALGVYWYRDATDERLAVDPRGATVTSYDAATGVISGTLGVNHPAGDAVTYRIAPIATIPGGGRLQIDAATATYTYTPTQSARLRAATSTSDSQEIFAVSASDGSAKPVTVAVTVPVAPTVLTVGDPAITVGDRPLNVAMGHDGALVYVLGAGDRGTVSVITAVDWPANHTVAAPPIRLERKFPSRFALTPDGARLYVSDVDTNTVSVVDTARRSVVGERIPVGNGPLGVAVSHDGRRVYVANTAAGTASVIDTATNRVIDPPLAAGTSPYGIALSPDDKRLYVIDRGPRAGNTFGPGRLLVIDTATKTVVGQPIVVGVAPEDVAISRDGTRVYVVNADEHTVSVIDTVAAVAVGAPIRVGLYPACVGLSPDGTLAYVTNSGDGTVSVIDTASNTVVGQPVTAAMPAVGGGLLYGIRVSPDGGRIYVTDSAARTVRVISFVATHPGR